MQKRNYAKELETILEKIQSSKSTPRLLLHACCAPCSSYVLEYLSPYFQIDLFFYNPNIAPSEEYQKRWEELQRLSKALPSIHKIQLLPCSYDGDSFTKMVKGLEAEPEGGARCERCFRLRLTEAAKAALSGKYDYFTTTLSISPLKNAQLLNELGEEIGAKFGVLYLPSDFKKKNGYKRSIELSREYSLYRQDYCGCIYSKAEREAAKQQEETPCR